MMRNAQRMGTFRLAALGVAATVVFGLAPAFAGEQKPTVRPSGQDSAPLMAAIDAKGRFRQPTAAEARQLVEGLKAMTATNKSAGSLPIEYWADGTMSIDLSGTYEHIWVSYVSTDGALRNACIENAEAAAALLSPAPAAEEK